MKISSFFDIIGIVGKVGYMSKYEPVWNYIKKEGRDSLKLTFEDIKNILGFEIDHSFLNYKKELVEFGYEVGKISLKEKTIIFNKINK